MRLPRLSAVDPCFASCRVLSASCPLADSCSPTATFLRLRSDHPDYRFFMVSEIDRHHNRCRDRWDMVRGDRVVIEGLDVVTFDEPTGLIARVDGFFCEPTSVKVDGSGVPQGLQRH